ncbi:hypothetical protein HMPREF0063_11713 [Aeromicrobium marinum DSM 15272]|uniref:LytR/CpsA/Psr regulator C-terminal domain-containing protein n=1 Tax=Aeromicrobium marinum DSM 15272 TaxID=585531 RepID=E2SDC7_9ACTN|nr:LytR C-terminal domain-containing protein [Aeromicrobium marinum]EFQ82504.1 hypothetical protein HMPREF0063_11713 [Aeromicrobium marinum DSM 15272]
MDHRRTISRKAFVPPVWLLVVTVTALVAGVAGLGWLGYDRYLADDTTVVAADPAPTPTPDADPAPAPTAEVTPTPTPTPSPEPELREAGVSVLNNTAVAGLAATFADGVEEVGWPDVTVGNWRGAIPENTVYFAPGLRDQADLLAADLGITRILPIVATMRTDRLTVILAEPTSSVP